MVDEKPILIPTDFTEKSKNAACYGLGLAKVLNKEIYLSHSYAVPSAGAGHFTGGLDHALEESSTESLRELESELENEAGGVKINYLAVKSEPIDGVIWAAEEVDAGLLIMGIQHADKMGEVLVGSVVTGVMRRDTPPMIVVPENFSFRPVCKIVVATDYRLRADHKGLEVLSAIQKGFNAEIAVVHIDVQMQGGKNEKTPYRLGDTKYECEVVHNKDIVAGIRSYMESKGGDLLVMVPGRHNLFQRLMRQSNTRRMVFSTGYPLLILEAEK